MTEVAATLSREVALEVAALRAPRAVVAPPPVESRADVGDGDLLLLARKGDVQAFGALYQRYVDRVYRFSLVRLGNAHDAEDCTEQTFLKAFQSIHRQSGDNLAAWLLRIAHRLIIDRSRRERRGEALLARTPPALALADPEAAVDTRDEVRELIAAVRTLTPDQQQVVVLRFIEGMSLAEVGEVLCKRVSAIDKLQARALATLERRLAASRGGASGAGR